MGKAGRAGPMLLLAAALALLHSVPPASGKLRIVDGTTATRAEFPYIVSVQLYTNPDENSFVACGGSLIAADVVLTAAHCTDRQGVPWDPSAIKIYAGGLQRSSGTEKSVSKVIQHPQWNSVEFEQDVAVLILESPYTIQADVIETIGLTTDTTFAENTAILNSGWGATSFLGPSSDDLLFVKGRTVNSFNGSPNIPATPGRILTRPEENDPNNLGGTCQGDSGGPTVIDNGDGTHTQIGLVSFGDSSCGTSSVDANVGFYNAWITEAMTTKDTPTTNAPSCDRSQCNTAVNDKQNYAVGVCAGSSLVFAGDTCLRFRRCDEATTQGRTKNNPLDWRTDVVVLDKGETEIEMQWVQPADYNPSGCLLDVWDSSPPLDNWLVARRAYDVTGWQGVGGTGLDGADGVKSYDIASDDYKTNFGNPLSKTAYTMAALSSSTWKPFLQAASVASDYSYNAEFIEASTIVIATESDYVTISNVEVTYDTAATVTFTPPTDTSDKPDFLVTAVTQYQLIQMPEAGREVASTAVALTGSSVDLEFTPTYTQKQLDDSGLIPDTLIVKVVATGVHPTTGAAMTEAWYKKLTLQALTQAQKAAILAGSSASSSSSSAAGFSSSSGSSGSADGSSGSADAAGASQSSMGSMSDSSSMESSSQDSSSALAMASSDSSMGLSSSGGSSDASLSSSGGTSSTSGTSTSDGSSSSVDEAQAINEADAAIASGNAAQAVAAVNNLGNTPAAAEARAKVANLLAQQASDPNVDPDALAANLKALADSAKANGQQSAVNSAVLGAVENLAKRRATLTLASILNLISVVLDSFATLGKRAKHSVQAASAAADAQLKVLSQMALLQPKGAVNTPSTVCWDNGNNNRDIDACTTFFTGLVSLDAAGAGAAIPAFKASALNKATGAPAAFEAALVVINPSPFDTAVSTGGNLASLNSAAYRLDLYNVGGNVPLVLQNIADPPTATLPRHTAAVNTQCYTRAAAGSTAATLRAASNGAVCSLSTFGSQVWFTGTPAAAAGGGAGGVVGGGGSTAPTTGTPPTPTSPTAARETAGSGGDDSSGGGVVAGISVGAVFFLLSIGALAFLAFKMLGRKGANSQGAIYGDQYGQPMQSESPFGPYGKV